jgi:putative protease
MTTKPELLAPAGDMESLRAAIENGADAVYLGARALSARGYATNFSINELMDVIDYAHLRGVKTYVTLNTLIKDSEIENAVNTLYTLTEFGVDSVIVQDVGLLSLARELVPELPVHASTQMTVHNIEGVRFLQEMGVKRAVLARELTLNEIKEIKEKTGIEIETFIHGALCISYSGQCLLSSLIGGRSGNRGHCAQPCRKRYTLKIDGKKVGTDGEYLLSPKDLNTTRLLPKLMDAGIDSFKIEGRMKRPEYVAGVTQVYRNLIDRYVEDPSGYFVSEDEAGCLEQLFNREFTEGYFPGNPRGKLMSRLRPYNRGIPIGTVAGYDRKKKRVRVGLTAALDTGDGIGIEGAVEGGETVHRMYIDGRITNHADGGYVVDIPFGTEVDNGSIVYRTLDKSLMDSLKKTFTSPIPIRKIPVNITAKAAAGSPLELKIEDTDLNMVHMNSDYVVEHAVKKPTTSEQIKKQLGKLGNTAFETGTIEIEAEDNIFVPMGQLNDVRNQAISHLEAMRIARWRRSPHIPYMKERTSFEGDTTGKPLLSVSVTGFEGFRSAVKGGADVIYIGSEMYRGSGTPGLEEAVQHVHEDGKKIYLDTPRIVKNGEMDPVREILSNAKTSGADGVLVSNLGVFKLAKHAGLAIIADSPLNVFNQQSLEFFLNQGAAMTVLSPELTLGQVKQITPSGTVECIVHGRLTLMESEHCLVGGILGGADACTSPCKNGEFELVDEKGYAFPIRMDSNCRTHLLNSKELCLLEDIPEIIKTGVSSIRIDAGTLEPVHIEKITKAYRNALDRCFEEGEYVRRSCKDITEGHTKGHYFRGVL